MLRCATYGSIDMAHEITNMSLEGIGLIIIISSLREQKE